MRSGRLGRERLGSVIVVVTAIGVALCGLVGSGTAGAAILEDRDPLAGVRVGDRLVALDAAIAALAVDVRDAEAAATAAGAAEVAAQGADATLRTNGPPAPRALGADTAAGAVLGDLAVEQASGALVRARQETIDTVARRDALRTRYAATVDERVQLVAGLDAQGQARTRWSLALLERLGAPTTSENLRALSAWIGAEANDVGLLNPLATTMDAPGARSVNSHGVKGYPAEEVGLDATVRTIQLVAYRDVVAALLLGDSAARVVAAVAASPWGTGQNAVARLALEPR